MIGVPHRIAGLDSALQYIRSHDRVWSLQAKRSFGLGCNGGATFRSPQTERLGEAEQRAAGEEQHQRMNERPT
jgi:hypothetical protein